MPFKSEKQRRYLWANEPEIARDWTDTYGSRIHKNEGGIMQAGVKNYLGKQKMVKAPLHWQSSPDHPKTELAYITQAEKDLLVKRDLHNSLHGGVNRGPAGIMSLNGWGSSDPGQNRAGADISAGMDRDPGHKGWSAPGGFTSPHAKSPAELKSLADRKGSSTVMPSSFYGNQSTNRGINFSFPGQNFMRNIHPLRWAGNLIDNPFVSGAWSFLTSPLSGMSNLRQGMTQQEWEDARNERIRNKRIENILGRKAPITDMTLKNLERLGYTGEMPAVGSSPKMMNMNNLGLYTDRVNQPIGPGKRVGQDQGYYGLGSRYDNQGGIYNISRGNDLSEIEGQVADINMPVSGLVNYDQYLENVADWPEHGLKEQFEEEGLTTPESQKQFFDVFEESLREQSRGLKRKTPSISTEDIQKAIDAGLIVIT